MTYIPYLETFFSHGTPVWPWPVITFISVHQVSQVSTSVHQVSKASTFCEEKVEACCNVAGCVYGRAC